MSADGATDLSRSLATHSMHLDDINMVLAHSSQPFALDFLKINDRRHPCRSRALELFQLLHITRVLLLCSLCDIINTVSNLSQKQDCVSMHHHMGRSDSEPHLQHPLTALPFRLSLTLIWQSITLDQNVHFRFMQISDRDHRRRFSTRGLEMFRVHMFFVSCITIVLTITLVVVVVVVGPSAPVVNYVIPYPCQQPLSFALPFDESPMPVPSFSTNKYSSFSADFVFYASQSCFVCHAFLAPCGLPVPSRRLCAVLFCWEFAGTCGRLSQIGVDQ